MAKPLVTAFVVLPTASSATMMCCGFAVEFARHLGDSGSVVGHRAEGVLGHDDTGRRQHAHARQCHEVEGQLDVAAAHPQGRADGDGDGDDGVDGGLEARRGAREHDGRRAGACGLGDLFDRAVVGGGEVLGEPADYLRQHETDDHGTEALPTRVGRLAGIGLVADVANGDGEGADDGEHAGDEEAAVDRLERVGLALFGAHCVHTEDRGHDADGAGGEREHQTERGVHADRLERGHTEDDRRDERDLVALEQVGGHAGAVADVVTDVVGDGRGVAGIVFGDAGFDLADEVGADVGGLGEDAAADTKEEGQQRATEAESDRGSRSSCSGTT